MAHKAIRGLTGILRIVTIGLGLVILIAFGVIYGFERFPVPITVFFTFFISSVAWLVILLVGVIHQEKISKRIDWIANLVVGILILLITIFAFIVLAMSQTTFKYLASVAELILWVVVLILGVVYLALAFFLFKSKQADDNVNYGDNLGSVSSGSRRG